MIGKPELGRWVCVSSLLSIHGEEGLNLPMTHQRDIGSEP